VISALLTCRTPAQHLLIRVQVELPRAPHHRPPQHLVVQHDEHTLCCARSIGAVSGFFLSEDTRALGQIALSMQYSTEEVPQAVQDALAAYRGNLATKNARCRSAVCEHLGLQWKSVNGDGNCFFEAVCQLLHAAGADKLGLFQRGLDALTPARLRLDIVRMFEACIGGKELFHERIQAEIEFEASQPLVCSTRAKIRGEKVNGLVPDSTAQYLEASAIDGVWVTGWQWLRAISFMCSVRVGVVMSITMRCNAYALDE
jgi:hypothetical protein